MPAFEDNFVENFPTVSVVMPFFNAEKFLDLAILSVLKQSLASIELILINDASTDDSDLVVRKYLYDKRIVYIKNERNMGIAYNENLGLKYCKSEYIARMDGDDISDHTRLFKQYNFLIANPHLSIVGSFASTIDEDGKQIGQITFPTDPNKISKTYFYRYPILSGSSMFLKKDIIAIGGYRQQYSLVDDTDLLVRLFMSGKLGANIPEMLLQYRKHKNSTDKFYKLKSRLMFQSRVDSLKKYRPNGIGRMYLFTYSTRFLELLVSPKCKNILFQFIKERTRYFQ